MILYMPRGGFVAVASAGVALVLLSVWLVYFVNISPVEPNAYGRAFVGVISVLSFAAAIGGVVAVVMAWVMHVTVSSLTRFYADVKESERASEDSPPEESDSEEV